MKPVTITIHYSDADVTGIDEESLVLEYWDEFVGAWMDAACGAYDRHPDENWLAVPICHLTPFALLGSAGAIPVGGHTEALGLLASSWLWVLAALVATGAIAALAFKRRTA